MFFTSVGYRHLAVLVQLIGECHVFLQEYARELYRIIELILIVLTHVFYESLVKPFLRRRDKHFRRINPRDDKQVALLRLEVARCVGHYYAKRGVGFLDGYPQLRFCRILVKRVLVCVFVVLEYVIVTVIPYRFQVAMAIRADTVVHLRLVLTGYALDVKRASGASVALDEVYLRALACQGVLE